MVSVVATASRFDGSVAQVQRLQLAGSVLSVHSPSHHVAQKKEIRSVQRACNAECGEAVFPVFAYGFRQIPCFGQDDCLRSVEMIGFAARFADAVGGKRLHDVIRLHL